MRQRIGMAGLAVWLAASLPGLALAASAENVGGVTILRGSGTAGTQSGNPAEVGSGSSTAPATGGGYSVDRSGDQNSLHTGSANAGGVIANPPPGAGR